jgi:hypothetical protein
MQNAVADKRVQGDTLGGTTTISLRSTVPAGTEQPRSEIEVIPETAPSPQQINDLHAIFCRDLLEFLGDFRSAAPKSRTARRLGQAVARGTQVVRDSALRQDILFDFLRAYEDAPKMRPLSQLGVGRTAPGTAGAGARSIGGPAAEPQPEDSPFRVPPYACAVSDDAAAEEALLDVDEVWPEPAPPSPAPVAKRPTRASVAKRQSPLPVAKGPAPAPVETRSDAVTVKEKPAQVVVSEVPAPVTVPERPAQVAAVPSAVPAVAATNPAPAVAAPSPAPVAVAKRQESKPAPAQPKKRPEPRPAPVPAVKPLGPAAARAKAIEEGLIVEISPPARSAQQPGAGSSRRP